MIKGIESQDWYRSEDARYLRVHIERRIDEMMGTMRACVSRGMMTEAASIEGGIQALERLRADVTPEAE